MKKVQRIDGFADYGREQTAILDHVLGLGFDDLPTKPARPVWCVTFRVGVLRQYFLQVEADTEATVREYCVRRFPLDFYTTYPQSLFSTLGAALGPLHKLNEVRLP